MKQVLYDSSGNILSTTDTAGGTLVYNRMDVGILTLNQAFNGGDIYDFRAPGSTSTFNYKFPRDGWLLGLTMTGSVSTAVTGGNYVSKYDNALGQYFDVMTPTDVGNQQNYDLTNFPKQGVIVMAPAPVPYKKNDVAAMKFKNMNGNTTTTNLFGFLLIGLVPQ